MSDDLQDDAWCPQEIEHIFSELKEQECTGRSKRSSIALPERSVDSGKTRCFNAVHFVHDLNAIVRGAGESQESPSKFTNGMNVTPGNYHVTSNNKESFCKTSSQQHSFEGANSQPSSPRSYEQNKALAHDASVASLWEQQLRDTNNATFVANAVLLSVAHDKMVPQHDMGLPAMHPVQSSQFFSLAGEHTDSRQTKAQSTRQLDEVADVSGRQGTRDSCFPEHQQLTNERPAESLQLPAATVCSSGCTQPTTDFSDVPNSCPLSPQSCANEMMQLLLAGRHRACHDLVESSSPDISGDVQVGQTPSGAPIDASQLNYSEECMPPGTLPPRASTPLRPNRCGKRQRNSGSCESNTPSREVPPYVPQQLDGRANAAIVEIIENSSAWQEIFYYATTEPTAIRVRY